LFIQITVSSVGYLIGIQLDSGANISLDIWGSKAGRTAYGDYLEAQTKDYPAIHREDSYNSSQLWDVLSTMDILIIPSRWYENSPTVILEAQTIGRVYKNWFSTKKVAFYLN